jgi:hypothetical protein
MFTEPGRHIRILRVVFGRLIFFWCTIYALLFFYYFFFEAQNSKSLVLALSAPEQWPATDCLIAPTLRIYLAVLFIFCLLVFYFLVFVCCFDFFLFFVVDFRPSLSLFRLAHLPRAVPATQCVPRSARCPTAAAKPPSSAPCRAARSAPSARGRWASSRSLRSRRCSASDLR